MAKIGMVLEGGGARGAYHVGVYQAYLEHGYRFDGFVGTSIGAINAATFASHEFESALKLWENISLCQLFDADVAEVLEWETAKAEGVLNDRIKSVLSRVVAEKGIDTGKIRAFISTYIDEEAIRKAGLDVGLVTYSRTDKKPHELFVADIPEGMLIDYLMASSNLPGFKAQMIGDKKFIDGFVHNNLPVNMLTSKGYDEIIAVRTNSFGKIRDYDKTANVTVVSPYTDLADTLAFSNENSRADIQVGYFDGLKAIRGLQGRYYYLRDVNLRGMLENLMFLKHDMLTELKQFSAGKIVGNRILFEQVMPRLGKYYKLGKEFTYEEVLIAMLEHVAYRKGIERFKIYDFDQFVELIKKTKTRSSLGGQLSSFDQFFMSSKVETEKFIERFLLTLIEG